MFQNLDTWLVLLSLAVTIVALAAWIKNAGDDWLSHEASGDDVLSPALPAEHQTTARRDLRVIGLSAPQQQAVQPQAGA